MVYYHFFTKCTFITFLNAKLWCVAGVVAKEFFEKSKLPVQELSTIWYLCHCAVIVCT